jgi:hypothetical protein
MAIRKKRHGLARIALIAAAISGGFASLPVPGAGNRGASRSGLSRILPRWPSQNTGREQENEPSYPGTSLPRNPAAAQTGSVVGPFPHGTRPFGDPTPEVKQPSLGERFGLPQSPERPSLAERYGGLPKKLLTPRRWFVRR